MLREAGLVLSLSFLGLEPALAQAPKDTQLREERLEEARITRPALSKLAATDQLLVIEWLSIDCAVDNQGLEKQLRAHGSSLQEAVLEAYRRGPMNAEFVGIEGLLGRQYERMQEEIASSGAAFLGEERAQSLMRVTKDVYVRQELERFRTAQRSAAPPLPV